MFALMAMGGIDVASATAQGPMFRPGPGGSGGYSPYGQSPSVSPYLNLLRPGSSTAINYYGLVRPAIDFQNAINTLEQQVTNLPLAGTGGPGSDNLSPLFTGNRPRFMNTGNYFLSGVPTGYNRGGMGGGNGGIIVVNQAGAGGAGAAGAASTGGSANRSPTTAPTTPKR